MPSLLLISRCPPVPLHLGDRLIVWHLARELAQRGYAIDLLAFAQRETDWQEIDEYRQFFRHVELFPEAPRRPRALLQRLLLPWARFPQSAAQAWSGAMWQAIEARLRSTTYDAIHLFGGVQVYEFAPLFRDLPALITPYESYSLYLKRLIAQGGGLAARLQRRFAQHYERWMYTPYAGVVVLSPPDRDELHALNPALSLHVIPNGIDTDFFTPQDTPRDPATLLFVGNYEYAPNVDAALTLVQRILPAVQQHNPQARAQLVGNAPPPEVRALHSASVEVTGRVPDVRPYLAQATAFVCPLRVGAGIKNKVLEALAMGLPVVASPLSVDGIAAQHGTHALIAPVESLADETLRLLRDPALQQRLAQQGAALIQARYSWSGVADRYEALYRQVGG